MLHKSRILAFFIVVYLLVIWAGTISRPDVSTIYCFPPLITSVFFWRNKFIRYGALTIFIFILGFAQMSNIYQQDQPVSSAEFYGTVLAEPKNIGMAQSVAIENNKVRMSALLPDYPTLQVGDRVKIAGDIISVTQDKYFQSNPNYHYLNKIEYIIQRPHLVSNSGLDRGDYPSSVRYRMQRVFIAIRKHYENVLLSVLPQPQGGLAVGILLGNRDHLDANIENIFITIGVIHIIALSGYNITIIARSLELLGKKHSAKISFYVAMVGVWSFVVATGFSASVVRAAIMGTLVLLARRLGRQSDSFIAILIAAGVMVFINPLILRYDIGFQLSFVAMTGIIFLAPRLKIYFQKLGNTFSEIVSSTIAAQVFTLPLLSYYFGRVSMVSPVANMLILPFIPLVMVLIFIVGTIGLFSLWLAKYIGFVLWFFLGYMVKISEILASVPNIEKKYSISLLTMIGIYIIMIELLIIIDRKRKLTVE